MSINERIYRIDQLLKDRKSISFDELKDKLEISRATLKRDIAYMRDRLNVPIIFDRELRQNIEELEFIIFDFDDNTDLTDLFNTLEKYNC